MRLTFSALQSQRSARLSGEKGLAACVTAHPRHDGVNNARRSREIRPLGRSVGEIPRPVRILLR